MNKLFFIIANVFILTAFSQTAIESEIKEVKIYRQNAQITREVSTKITAGKQEIVLTGISTVINPSSLQVQLATHGDVTILSAKYERNYLLPIKVNPELQTLKDQVEILNDEISWIAEQTSIFKGMEDVMNKNKDLGGNDAGFTPNQVAELANIYKTKLFEIRKEQIVLRKENKEKTKERNAIQNQLNELNAKFNKPSGNIVLQISSKAATTANFKCSYIVSNAGWNPLYDLRSEGITKDVQLNYKAKVYQTTGQDWNNAQLYISTGNPSKNNDRPILTPLYTNIYVARYNDQGYGERENKKIMAPVATNMAYEIEATKDKNYSPGFRYDAQVNENQLSVEFEISHKQDIASDGKMNIVPLESYTLNTEYVYHTVPKLDHGAFLLAKVSNWGQYNLISGEANIFFEGAYVGKSHINSQVTSDTLLLSMGRDESISVHRKAVKEFTERKFLGANTKETYGFEIIVKNKKSIGIDIEILDQIPVSQNKVITVELEETGNATYVKKVGKLLWKLNIPAGQSKKVQFKYFVKYPKDEKISGVK